LSRTPDVGTGQSGGCTTASTGGRATAAYVGANQSRAAGKPPSTFRIKRYDGAFGVLPLNALGAWAEAEYLLDE